MRKKRTDKLDTRISTICSNRDHNENVPAIVFHNKRNRQCVLDKLNELGCNIKYTLDFIDAIAVDVSLAKISVLVSDEDIVYISSDTEVTTNLDIAKKAIGVNNSSFSGKNIGVAVIDTGIFPHADLTAKGNRIVEFVDFVGNKNKPYDDNGHGTHCAGIIAGDGTSSKGLYSGIAPNANLIGLKVMDAFGSGNASDILSAMDWVYKNKEKYNIRIVSMSLGASAIASRFDPMIVASEKLWNSGIVVVASAGNEGPQSSTISSPGASKKIITVGCSDDKNTVTVLDDDVAEFSSRGPSVYSRFKPDIVAPGVDIVSLSNKGGYVSMSGTSMSAPMISGLSALMLEKDPTLTPDVIKQKLYRNTISLNMPYTVQGKGLVRAASLLK